jgi:crotonobetainyl-CoA:carnitine CoA-transferase CaiB-like acyl-CoA transferase
MAKPLDGITVVEFASNLGSAYAAMLLAEYGAATVRIEPREGDPARATPHFHVLNRSKQALFLDLDSSADLDQARELIKMADVVVSGFTPARERLLGLDPESLARLNPTAVMLRMPPLGSRGPYAEIDADDELLRAWSGIFGSQASRSGNPVATVFPAPSYEAGLLGAAGATAALIAREHGRRFAPVEVSLLAGSLALQSGDFLRNPRLPTTPPGPTEPLGPYAVIRLFKGSDGLYLIVDCTSARFCQRLAGAIGQPNLFEDPRFKEAPWRVPREHIPALKDVLDRAFLTRPRDEWIRILRQYEVPSAPVLTRDQFMQDAQVIHLGMRREVHDPELGHTIQIGPPISLSETPAEIARPAPAYTRSNPALDSVLEQARRNGAKTTAGSAQIAGSRAPLDGIRVIDCSSYIAGSFGPMLLAHLGAEVIKIEGPDGDSLRHVTGFRAWNQNKFGLGLDIKSPKGLEILHELVRKADVFVENFRPGRTRAIGIDYERLSGINPRLIYMSVTGFGSSGPDYDRPGLDPLVQAMSGTMTAHSGIGYNGDASPKHPLYMTVPIADYGAATLSALGCVLALRARQLTGRGQYCETSLIHAVMALQAGEFVFYPGRPNLDNGAPESRGPSALHRAYQCQDGRWIYLAVDARSWEALRSRIKGLPDVSFAQAREAGPEGDLARAIAQYCQRHPAENLFQEFLAGGIPVARVPHLSEMFDDPQVIANQLATMVQDPEVGAALQGAPFIKFNGANVSITPAPRLGEHSGQVLAQVLGYDAQQIAELRQAGVVFGG